MPEECGVCGETVPFGETVHLIVNTQSDAGTFDRYVCRSCYEDELEPLVA
ncbi:hypothetical protein ACFQMA_16295 [Halosimplex aquaticum]|uniref:Small CPxCG-related zinc finger protein n=1 Tax=Halosimplex aquaticum TaxID=3026162 RepID=A0ABD5Y7S7_9EURY|nr:hypothetical protein [Halosimplex aquaticum]